MRDARVLDAIRAGADLDETGQAAGVTRERIRQLVREAAARTAYDPRDLLAVCHDTETTVRLADIPRRLRAFAPDHPPYSPGMGLLGTRLGEQLSAEGVRVVPRDGRPVRLDVANVREVLADRVTAPPHAETAAWRRQDHPHTHENPGTITEGPRLYLQLRAALAALAAQASH